MHSFSLHRLAPVIAMMVVTVVPAQAESWTSLNGGRTVEAKMVGMWADSIVLEMEDGRRVTVQLADLRAESRIQARDLAKVQAANRSNIIKEFKDQAEEAAAPAPTPIPKPEPAPRYVQPKPNAGVIDQLRMVDEQSRQGHLLAAFDSLPPSYRKDVSDYVKRGAAKVNADTWDGLIKTVHSVGDVIVTKQRWIFSHPRLEAMNPGALEPIQDILLLVGGLIRDGLDPQAMDLQRLQSTPLRDWLAERDKAISPYLAALSEYSGAMGQQSFELVSEKDGVANVKASVGEFSVTIPYTKVEGFWVPKELADRWPTLMKDKLQELDETPDGTLLTNPMLTMLPTMIQPVIGPLASATDKKGFHVAMEGLFAQAAPMATLAGVDLSGRGRSSSSYDGYDEGYPDGYGEEMEEMDSDYEAQMNSEYPGSSGSGYSGGSGPPPGAGGRSGGPRPGSGSGYSGGSGPPPGAGSGSGPRPGAGSAPRGGPRPGSGSGRRPGTGGSSDANPNIGARLEDQLRGR